MIGVLLGGAAGGAAYWGGAWGVLIWVAFVPLFHIAATREPKRAFFLGWAFGVAYWTVGAYWTYAPAVLLMNTTLTKAVLASIPFLLFWAFPWALAAAAASWSGFPWLIVPAAVAIEAFWPQIYPSYLAVALVDHLPAIQSASLFGAGGIAFLIMGFNGSLFSAVAYRRWRPLAALIPLLIANQGYGLWSMGRITAEDAGNPKRLRVAILQAAVPDAQRWNPQRYGETLSLYHAMIEGAKDKKPDLIVFPPDSYERVWTYGQGHSPWEKEFPEVMRAEFPSKIPLLLGARTKEIVRYRGKTAIVQRHLASVLVRSDRTYGGHSEKRNPTPFSEWMPGVGWFPALRALVPSMVRIHGGENRALKLEDGTVFGSLICYDAVKPWNARRLASEAQPSFFVVQSNDSWADKKMMPSLSLRVAVLRAVENRTPTVRAMMSGVSTIIDRAGRAGSRLAFGRRGVLVVDVPLGAHGSLYAKTGNAAYAAALVLVGAVLLGAGLSWFLKRA